MRITKITIEGEDGSKLYWTPFSLADYYQILGTFESMLHEFNYHPDNEEDMIDDE